MTEFAARIRRATMAEHREAETRSFISRLMAGEVPYAGYAVLTAQYLHIYRELEAAAARMRTDEVAAGFADPLLDRVPSLEADVRFLGSADVRPLEATRRYVARLREQCHDSAVHFIAHHYVRYLGDLSGGLMVGRSVAQTYGLGPGGVAFYSFLDIPDSKAYKTAYRTRLDSLPAMLGPAELDDLVAESQLAFKLNAALFVEMGRRFSEVAPAA
ncbi:heme oxygenase (biliverdin-producing) [Paractinoplanes lichenicola]|uniref:Biliverdin-producing heme oxygenase n=1 Tax=Paractinoplanes lichenicola TaxID=2802976 RepID=A0ABS1VWL3_9ACTN|nr:biliverdin-producing heme oxygenase [Actinoplanes lichenicola]MBL7258877.1 biliverdin-producing heme oxygenase [Actinoplanes lichenicola]